MTSIITCQSSAQENCDANNAVTRAAGHTPDEEEQPIQAKAAYQTRNTTPSAASTGRTAQGGSKTAGCGEEHSRRRITSQHKTTGNMSRPLDINEQSANNSASPQRQQQVNSRTDQSMRGTRQQQGPQSSWTAQLKSPWHETQDGGAAEDADSWHPWHSAARMFHRPKTATQALFNSVLKQIDHWTITSMTMTMTMTMTEIPFPKWDFSFQNGKK